MWNLFLVSTETSHPCGTFFFVGGLMKFLSFGINWHDDRFKILRCSLYLCVFLIDYICLFNCMRAPYKTQVKAWNLPLEHDHGHSFPPYTTGNNENENWNIKYHLDPLLLSFYLFFTSQYLFNTMVALSKLRINACALFNIKYLCFSYPLSCWLYDKVTITIQILQLTIL